MVANWFEMPDLGDAEVEEIEITNNVYPTRCTFKEISKDEDGKALITKYLGNFSENTDIGMALGMKSYVIATMAEGMFNEKMMYILNKELTKIKKS